ncbi:MAG: hypothetical protein COW59_06175 [Lysobacterales bacterium CG17_big_fil_post_rev_8_21_14_2_50_64_11]|nr:MAG: hypothetical protein COW59_06175 [Xanthomonadales bacterium CG17_big_fil_post_rev_8_21_14_2_50_64_11]
MSVARSAISGWCRDLARGSALSCALLCSAIVLAQPAQAPVVLVPIVGELAASEPLLDPEFGIAVRALALHRRVEMWQWQVLADAQPGAERYQAQWSQQQIDSSGFDAAHHNPTMPFASAQWLSASALLNAQPVTPALLATLDGWQPLSPQADRLPENLAAVFRTEAGLLVTGDDSSQPQIGDLRITWETLPAGPVHGMALVDDGGLTLAEGAGLTRGVVAGSELPGLAQGARAGSDLLWWLIAAVLTGLIALLVMRWRARR